MDFAVYSQGYLEFNLGSIADKRGLNVDCCFWWDDDCGDRDFGFSSWFRFFFLWDQLFPFGCNLDSLSFVVIFDYALFGEKL